MKEIRLVELFAPGCKVDGRRLEVTSPTVKVRFADRPDIVFAPTGRVTSDGYEVWAER